MARTRVNRHGFASSDFFYHTLASALKGGFSDTPSVRGLVGCRRFQAACAKTQRRNLVSLSWIRFSPTLYNMAVSVCSHTFLPQRSRVATTPDPGRFLNALPLRTGRIGFLPCAAVWELNPVLICPSMWPLFWHVELARRCTSWRAV